MKAESCANCGHCPTCGLVHERTICPVSGADAHEAHHQLGRHLDPNITGPRSQVAHDDASERQRISGIPMRAEGKMRDLAAARHGMHEIHELLDAAQRHYEAAAESEGR